MKEPAATPGWVSALLAMIVVQMATAFLTRVTPTIAPAVAAELQWSDAVIGYLSSIATVGSITFLVMGAPLMRRFGSIRALQLGLGLGIFGLCFLLPPLLPVAMAGAFLIGLGYGPSSPAGSDVLHRIAPPRHHALIFSLKQAGVPAGGIIAGLALPPIVAAYGWRASLLFSALLVVAVILVVQPMRSQIDAGRERQQSLAPGAFLSLSNVLEPLRALRGSASVMRIAAVGACLAIGQGIWFAYLITFAVSELGYDLRAAGLAFALMQATGVLGRVLLGWVADRMRATIRLLALVCLASGLTSLALMLATPTWPSWLFYALAAVAGITVSSWNGVQIAEIARRSPAGRIREAASGATVVVFLGYVAGPLSFALLVATTGRFDLGFLLCAAAGLLGFLLLATRRGS
ncbi:MFS transporter [Bosea sp. (in: a-proteobacteria)]|uniref:MFS transporter n=1 Tax=Bosea sp. (in: a-proteobacteria) TaxID=1871050 RepID=UPI002FC88BD2